MRRRSYRFEPTLEHATRVLRAFGALPFGIANDIEPAALIERPVTMIGDMPNVDVLTRAWDLTWDIAERGVVVFQIEGVPVPKVSIEHLIESKRTGRTQDAADIEVLEALLRLRAR